MEEKIILFNLRIDPDTLEKLKELARNSERSAAQLVRHLIRTEWERKYGETELAQPETQA